MTVCCLKGVVETRGNIFLSTKIVLLKNETFFNVPLVSLTPYRIPCCKLPLECFNPQKTLNMQISGLTLTSEQ